MSLLIFFWIFLFSRFVYTAPSDGSGGTSVSAIEQCQNGRVCMNSCYSNNQLSNCNKQYVLKSVLFDPPFDGRLPSIHLKFVRLHPDDGILNEDVKINKENFTSRGINIRFSLSSKSTTDIFCVDWQACSVS